MYKSGDPAATSDRQDQTTGTAEIPMMPISLTQTPTVGPACRKALPPSVESFSLAVNSFDLDRLVLQFAEDGVVNDQLYEYRGLNEIRAWAKRDVVGNRLTMHITDIFQNSGTVVATAHVDGIYEKRGLPDPLVLSFYFSVSQDKIALLIILRNEPEL